MPIFYAISRKHKHQNQVMAAKKHEDEKAVKLKLQDIEVFFVFFVVKQALFMDKKMRCHHLSFVDHRIPGQ